MCWWLCKCQQMRLILENNPLKTPTGSGFFGVVVTLGVWKFCFWKVWGRFWNISVVTSSGRHRHSPFPFNVFPGLVFPRAVTVFHSTLQLLLCPEHSQLPRALPRLFLSKFQPSGVWEWALSSLHLGYTRVWPRDFGVFYSKNHIRRLDLKQPHRWPSNYLGKAINLEQGWQLCSRESKRDWFCRFALLDEGAIHYLCRNLIFHCWLISQSGL